jgi:hypothetical protein
LLLIPASIHPANPRIPAFCLLTQTGGRFL